jgi:hypothetical protein
MVTELTPEQEAAIPFYQQKWQNISRSTEPINRDRVLSILKDINDFHLEGDLFPEIIFFDSPFAAFNSELEKMLAADFENTTDDEASSIIYEGQFICGEGLLRMDLWFGLDLEFSSNYLDPMSAYNIDQFLRNKLIDQEGGKQHEVIWLFLKEWLRERLCQNIDRSSEASISFWCNFMDLDSEWLTYAGLFDFYINELKYPHDHKEWEIYKKVLSECGSWFLPSSRHWVICDRPIRLLFDEENNLHAEGEPAIEYSDGFALYIEHGKIQSMVTPNN